MSNCVDREKALTAKEQAFIEAYLANGRNGTQAAITVGYAKASARVTASRMLTKANIRSGLDTRELAIQTVAANDTGITIQRLVAELAHTAFLNCKDFYGKDGRVLAIVDMPENAQRALKTIESEDRYDASSGSGDAEIVVRNRTSRITPNDKRAAIELIAKLLGFLRDKQDVAVTVGYVVGWADE